MMELELLSAINLVLPIVATVGTLFCCGALSEEVAR